MKRVALRGLTTRRLLADFGIAVSAPASRSRA